jgi:hypothetical protein
MITEEKAQEWIYWTDTPIPDEIDRNYAYWDGEKWNEDSEHMLQDKKDRAINQLWSNYKAFQRRYVDPEDLTLATTLSLANQPMGTAVRNWVFQLWDAYYILKGQIENATTVDVIENIDLAVTVDAPPYTIKQLNEEAKELQQ